MFESKSIDNDVKDVLNSRFTLVEHIINDSVKNKKKIIEDRANLQVYKKQDKDVRLLPQGSCRAKFNKKYTNLNNSQKNLLKEYINNVNNTSKFVDYYRGRNEKTRFFLIRRIY